MKRKLIYIFSLIVGLLTLLSCDFDTDIYTAIDMDNAFGSAQDIQNALNGAYRNVGYYPYRGNRVIAIGDMASDIAEADASSGHFVAINMWTFSDTSEELLNVWTYAYKVIDQSTRGINGALDLLESGNLPDGDDVKLKSALSQFYALRALAHFDLVNLFGLPYKAGGGNSQLGVVVIDKEPIEEFQQVSRSTVEETYAQILKDITSAKEYATDDLNQYYFNEAAIFALDARVKLYMHKYDEAIQSAEMAIELRNSDGVDNATYLTMWRSTAITGEDIFTLVKSEDDNLSANALNTLYGSYGGRVSEFTKNRFQPTDIRLKLIYDHKDYGVNHPGKYDGLPSAAAVSNIPVFRLSEMYLIIAEAETRLGNDLTAAKNALLYTAKRNTAITSISDLPSTQNELLNFIEEERIREFFTEGHRFYDLRRTGATATIAGDTQFKAADFVYPIPSEEINSGFGVTQNENWSDKLPNS
jgi:tetratricopeptide (TPR) repeat protein